MITQKRCSKERELRVHPRIPSTVFEWKERGSRTDEERTARTISPESEEAAKASAGLVVHSTTMFVSL